MAARSLKPVTPGSLQWASAITSKPVFSPITRSLLVIVDANLDTDVAAFIEFLSSPEVKEIISAFGAVPVN
jgi:ABC-type phosphate transport system substrate-binding protein